MAVDLILGDVKHKRKGLRNAYWQGQRDKLFELYHCLYLSQRKVALHFNVSHQTIGRALDQVGITKRPWRRHLKKSKKCPQCHQVLPLKAFIYSEKRKWFSSYCKTCSKAYGQQYRQTEQYKKRLKVRRAERLISCLKPRCTRCDVILEYAPFGHEGICGWCKDEIM